MQSATPTSDTPFFHRRETHLLIDSLRTLDNVTIYVGAGSSVERTGLTWGGLTAELLPSSMGTFSERARLATAMNPLAASSVVEHQRRASSPAGWRRQLTEDIRAVMTRGDDTVTGTFNEQVASLIEELHSRGRAVALVTPNYDDFLIRNLLESLVPLNLLVLGVPVNDAEKEQMEKNLDELPDALQKPNTVVVVYLHGLVTQRTDFPEIQTAADGAHLVVSEADYDTTAARSARALRALFEDRNLLVLGSSVTDPPLTSALLATAPSHGADIKRLAVVPHQGLADGVDAKFDDALVRAHRARVGHLGAELVVPDYFIQVPQLVEEVRFAQSLEETESYADPLSTSRYGRRLADWWRQWYFQADDLGARQHRDHALLAEQLRDIRRALGAPASEPLRLEVWLRWLPKSSRELRLWASSVGSWPEPAISRRDTISARSKYVSVRAFTSGGITYFSEPEGPGRWRSYLAKPVRFQDETTDGQVVSVPVGVATLASMWSGDASSLSPSKRSTLSEVTVLMDAAAEEIVKSFVDPTVSQDANAGPKGLRTRALRRGPSLRRATRFRTRD